MELYGSLFNISGSVTASAFSGSFVGDASGLYNLQASGVTGLNLSQIGNGPNTASVSSQGFQVNTDTSITGALRVSGIITAEQFDVTVVSSSVLFQSGSTKFGDTLDDTHNITGSVNISGSITLNGQAIGTGKLDETTFQSYTSSNDTTNTNQNNRLNALESTTGSLNSFTNSINTTIKNKLNTENVISGSIQVDITNTTNYSSFSSSIATVNSNQDGRLNAIEIMTNSINNFSYSIDTTIKSKLNVENVVSSSGQITLTSVNGYTTFSSSIATTDSNQENRLSALETTTGSLNTFTSSALTRVSAIETTTGSLNTFTSSANGRLNSLESASGSIRTDFNSYTSSNDSTNTTRNNRLDSIETSTSSLNTFSSSTNTRLGLIETSTGSLNSFTNSINTTIKNKLNSENVISGSVQVDVTSTTGYSTFSSSISSSIGQLSGSIATTTNGLSSSVATYNLGQDNRLNSIEGKTGSYATTGSNSFLGTQNITGSLYISENLTVYGSSSLVYVTSSQLAVSSSFISVNVFEPAERFGGLKVYDSGSSAATASLAWDSLNNRWVYQNVDGASYGGAILIAGPRNTGSLGDETTLTSGKIPKSVGGDHIDNSIMNETSGVIYVTGSLSATGTISGTNITVIETTTGSLNSYTSSNTTNINAIHTATSSLNSYTSSTNSRLTSIETSTGSLNSFTNSINTTIKSKLNSDGVISGSSQVDFGTISNKPTLVSGSSQITYSGISSIPSGIVSGSSQIIFGSISGVPSGIVSGSSQITFGSISGVPSGIVSGSSQVSYTGLSNVPSGIVSGSAQLTSTFVQKAGDTVTGIVYSTYNTATGRTNLGFSTAKTTLGNIHVQNGSGPGNDNSNQAAITFQGGSSSEAQAGIYVLNNGSYGTSMGFATTESYTTGPQLFMTATNGGVVNFPRAVPTYNGTSLVYNSGTWGISISGNAATASTVSFSSGTAITHTGSGNVYLAKWTGSGTPVPFTISAAGSTNSDSATYGTLLIDRSNITANGAGANFHFTLSGVEYGGMGVTAETGISSGATVGKMRWYLTTATNTNRQEKMTLDSSGHLYTYGNIGIQATPRGYYYSAANRYGINIGGYGDLWTLSNQSLYLGANVYYDNGWYRGPGATVGGWFEVAPSASAFYFSSIASGTANASVSPTTLLSISFSNGAIIRNSAGFGYLSGNYSSAENASSTGAIYTIGGSYNPTATSLNNMYGIGYTNISGNVSMTNASGWGMYVAANGTPYVWLGAEGNPSVFRGSILPHSNNSYNLGSASYGWANVYTNDLHLSNMNKPEGNDIDGTSGSWTIQEGAENLYIINNNNGKKFKISLEEIK